MSQNILSVRSNAGAFFWKVILNAVIPAEHTYTASKQHRCSLYHWKPKHFVVTHEQMLLSVTVNCGLVICGGGVAPKESSTLGKKLFTCNAWGPCETFLVISEG